mgnify:CR=1 FL=1
MEESRKLSCKLTTHFICAIILCLFHSAMSFVHEYVHVCLTVTDQAILCPVAAELKSFFEATKQVSPEFSLIVNVCLWLCFTTETKSPNTNQNIIFISFFLYSNHTIGSHQSCHSWNFKKDAKNSLLLLDSSMSLMCC